MARKLILVNDRSLFRRLTGIGHYLAALIEHWPKDADVDLISSFRRTPLNHLSREVSLESQVDDLQPIRLKPLTELSPPLPTQKKRLLSAMKPTLNYCHAAWMKRSYHWRRCVGYFEPNNLPCFSTNPCITTLADLSVIELPHVHPADRVAAWQRQIETCLRWTTHFITYSTSTAERMVELLGVAKEKITVIGLGSRWQRPQSWDETSVRTKLRAPNRYLLHLGTIEPRKNLKCLLDAYLRQHESWRKVTPLILAGTAGWGEPAFWRELCTHPMAQYVYTTGYLSEIQAQALLFCAKALVFPSLYEGFGLPALEAMAMGVPVVASNTTSLPEVCGDAAVLLSPDDIDAWAEWIANITAHSVGNALWGIGGMRQAKRFTWKRAAQEHHDLFDRLCVGSVASQAA